MQLEVVEDFHFAGTDYTAGQLIDTTALPPRMVRQLLGRFPVAVADGSGTSPLPTTATDGQVLVWNATLGKWQPANPSGNAELASAQNVTGTLTTATAPSGGSQAIDVPGVAINVPVSARPVWLEWGGTFEQTVAGAGSVALIVYETTSGAVLVTYAITGLGNAITAAGYRSLHGRFRLGPTAAARQFKLTLQVAGLAGNAPAGSLFNSAALPSYLDAKAA